MPVDIRCLGGGSAWRVLVFAYACRLNSELFVALLRRSMHRRRRPLSLIPDGLPVHRTRLVRDHVDSMAGNLSLHFLSGDAPDEKSTERIDQRLVNVCDDPKLDRTLYQAPPVANIRDC